MSPMRRRCLLAIQPSPFTSQRSSRADSMPPTDRLSRSSTSSRPASLLSVIGKTVEKVEEQLGYSGDASLVYAGYPFDPFRPDKSVH